MDPDVKNLLPPQFQVTPEPVSRETAANRGSVRYYTGRPCRRGHLAERLVSTRSCVECRRMRDAASYASNPEPRRRAAQRRAWRRAGAALPTRPCPDRCELCGRVPGERGLHSDHDHDTGRFRGWLCVVCNTGLGKIGDSLDSALALVRYLRGSSTPAEAGARKQAPIASGVLSYFPDALVAVAQLSKIGNDQHNPGQPMHWAREKSSDHADCIVRHLLDRGTLDTDGVLHDTKVAWRALAMLQLAIEKRRAG